MVTVSVEDKYVEALAAFGDVDMAVDMALKRYTIEQITVKIEELRERKAQYEAKYGMDYPAFVQRIETDETFVRQVEDTVDKKWEIDLADWEFCHKGIQDWTEKLQTILLT